MFMYVHMFEYVNASPTYRNDNVLMRQRCQAAVAMAAAAAAAYRPHSVIIVFGIVIVNI